MFAKKVSYLFNFRLSAICFAKVVAVFLLALNTPTAPIAKASEPNVSFTAAEVALISSLGPWPKAFQPDPSNALSGNRAAIALGARLFANPQLSQDGTISCLTCHRPPQGFSDGLALSQGKATLTRNSQSLWNLNGQRWFAWDGASDSLWLHSLKPMLHPQEMGASIEHIAKLMQSDAAIEAGLKNLPPHNFRVSSDTPMAERLALTAAKAIASFVETFRSPRTAFDAFRDAITVGDTAKVQVYPQAEQRGLKIFIDKGNCISCHAGPSFTNGEFADNGVGHFRSDRSVDTGRHGGVASVLRDRYNLLGQFSDAAPSDQTHTRYVAASHALFGQFKVPGLRELNRSAPYMHDGRITTLRDVVKHYSTVSPDRLHSDGEKSMKALNLNDGEIDDLVAFLRSLSFRLPPPPAPR